MAITSPMDAAEVVTVAPWSRWITGAMAFSRRRPLGAIGAVVVVLMIVVALSATFIAPYDPLTVDFGAMLAPPSAAHWLGTDAYGRDVLSRLIYGSRTALIVGFGAAFVGATDADGVYGSSLFEIDGGATYRFNPNLVFNLFGGVMFPDSGDMAWAMAFRTQFSF